MRTPRRQIMSRSLTCCLATEKCKPQTTKSLLNLEKRRSVTMDWENISSLVQLSSMATQLNQPPKKSAIDNQHEILIHLNFLQSVFVKLSSLDKKYILHSLLMSVSSNQVLSSVTSILGFIFTKDVLYVLSQNVHAHAFDKIPLDDSRSLCFTNTHEMLCQKALWFLGCDEVLQEKIILALLKCAGGAAIRRTFVYALKSFMAPPLLANYSRSRRSVPSILPGFIPPPYTKVLHHSLKGRLSSTSSTSGTLMIKPLNFNLGNDLSLTVVAGSKYDSLLNSDFSMSTYIVSIDDWKNELSSLREKILALLDDDVEGGNTEVQEFDALQMLPSWIIEKIISYLDTTSRNELKKVSEYWSFIVDEVINEEDQRYTINRIVSRLNAQFSNVVEEIEVEPKGKKKGPKSKKGVKEKSSKKKLKAKQVPEPVEEPVVIETPTVVEVPQIQPDEKKYLMSDFGKNPLSGKYSVVAICDLYRHNRLTICTANGKFLITTAKSHTMVVHSLLTGCQLTTKLVGHTGPITCLTLHHDGCHVISGSVDATVRFWDFKHRIQEHIYIGHSKTITAVSANSKYIASAAYDKLIIVHDIKSTLIFWSFEDQTGIVSALYLTEDNIYTGWDTGIIKKYHVSKKKVVTQFSYHNGEVKFVFISSYLPLFLITGGADGFLNCFNVREILQAKPIYTCSHASPVTGAAVTPSGCIITGCEDGRLRIWNSSFGLLLRVIRPSADLRPIRNVHCFSFQGVRKVVVNLDTGIFVFEFDFLPYVIKKKQLIYAGDKIKKFKAKGSEKQLSFGETSFPSVSSVEINSSPLSPVCSLLSSLEMHLPSIGKETDLKGQKRLPSTRSLYYCCAGTKIDPNDDDGEHLKISEFSRLTRKELRMKALDMRCCTLPKIRNKSVCSNKTTNNALVSAMQKNPRTAAQVASLKRSYSSLSRDQSMS